MKWTVRISVNKDRKRSNRLGLSDVLGYNLELKAPPTNFKTVKIVGHKTKFVMTDDIPEAELADAGVTVQMSTTDCRDLEATQKNDNGYQSSDG